MPVLQRWRSIFILNNAVTRSASLGAATTCMASLHSTNAFFDKWKDKFECAAKSDQESLKTYIRYTVRKNRADIKKALNGTFLNVECSTSRHEMGPDYADQLNKKSRIKPARNSKRASNRKFKRKHRREDPSDDYNDDPAKTYSAAFRKGSSWNFRQWEQRSQWTEHSNWSYGRFSEQDSKTRSQSQSFALGTYADRKSLGLPATGPLKIEDVKAAFRSSALKWHPDRHQGSSPVAAEEKFKRCLDAYKSLCKNL